MANDRFLVRGELSASSGLSGPLITEHTRKCPPRAHDFKFSTGKGSWEGAARRPDILTYASVSILLFILISSYLPILPSVLPLTHSLTYSSIQVLPTYPHANPST